MGIKKDLTNRIFGKLKVLKYVGKDKNRHSKYLCKCECGVTKIITQNALVSGHTNSCGCIKKTKKGLSHTRLAGVYFKMYSRCYKEKDKNYKNYGARNIQMCEQWKNEKYGLMNFYIWAYNNGYDETKKRGKLTLDRINNDGDYEPNNCRFISIQEQALNKRNTIMIGEKTLIQICKEENINYFTAYNKYIRKKRREEQCN